ncbi:MAG: hypothetical protein HKN91_06215 [Acidimicrobiia bacterium]|nr:hypothetical protein [Acidimicrobiia bacterium]
MFRRGLVIAAVFALFASACGGDSGGGGGLDSDAQAISDAIFNQIMSENTANSPFGEGEARCFADGIAGRFSVAELTELGLSVENIEAGTEPGDVPLSDDQADRMTQLMTGCVDFRTLFVDEFTAGGVSDESAGCLADGFDDEFIQSLAKAELTGDNSDPLQDPDQAQKIFELITTCLTFQELEQLGNS